MNRLVLLLIVLCFSGNAQTHTITGIITDTLNTPLESANVIARPLVGKSTLCFAIADHKGRYKLELDKAVHYEITVSYIGYSDEILSVAPGATIASYDFRLKTTSENLKEIVINYDYKPVIVKKDTLIFDVKHFTNGNEHKMKEVLEKLPGVHVDKDGGVTVQGKKVTKMLVEGKSFFGGGSKLAVENIPADALDKIEVIDHFNEVGFMKKVSNSEDLAMNVKLKEDKKKFVFGDLEAGLQAGKEDKSYYRNHAALFYYNPKTNIGFIGDMNTVGKSTFTYDDLTRFDSGSSSYLSGRKSLGNLNSFTNDNTDVLRNKSQFSALNFSHEVTPKLSISGYGLFSKLFIAQKAESTIDYLQNDLMTFENRIQKSRNNSLLGIGNLKLEYTPGKNEKWYYNTQFKSSNNNYFSTLNSDTNVNSSTFEMVQNAENVSVKNYIEWHKNFNIHHTTTFVINQAYEKSTPKNQWYTNTPFLAGLIPLEIDSTYTISQIKKVKNNSIDALLKQYWILNGANHIYFNLGNNLGISHFETSEKQLLTNGTVNDFGTSGFGNTVGYKLNDAYVGLEYKFKIGKWTNKPALYTHWYHLQTQQLQTEYTSSQLLLQPQWDSDYEFNNSESLRFSYKLANDFPDAGQLANQFTLQNYNTVYKGNALLKNERFHSANLMYFKMNQYRGISWNAFAHFNKKVQAIRNQVTLDGINQYNSPITTDNPETNWTLSGAFSKDLFHFRLGINTHLKWFNYTQTLNTVTRTIDRNSQDLGISVRTNYKKWPDLSIGYNRGFSQFHSTSTIHYKSEAFIANGTIELSRDFIFKFDYQNVKNNNSNQNNFYEITSTTLRYQKKKSSFGFELSASNIFDTRIKNTYSFSDYMTSESNIYILPRMVLLSVSYKL